MTSNQSFDLNKLILKLNQLPIMRFNLFASSLIVALSAAIYIDAADVVTEHDNDTLMLAQVDSAAEWLSNGK